MGNGILSLLRIVAVLGMGLAAIDIVASVARWAAPVGGQWVGKRAKDHAVTSFKSEDGIQVVGMTLPEFARIEFDSACNIAWLAVRWFCLSALLFAATARPQPTPDSAHSDI